MLKNLISTFGQERETLEDGPSHPQKSSLGPSIKDVRIFQGERGSQIPMLQDIRKQKLGESRSKSRHREGGYQKVPKKICHLLWTAPDCKQYKVQCYQAAGSHINQWPSRFQMSISLGKLKQPEKETVLMAVLQYCSLCAWPSLDWLLHGEKGLKLYLWPHQHSIRKLN